VNPFDVLKNFRDYSILAIIIALLTIIPYLISKFYTNYRIQKAQKDSIKRSLRLMEENEAKALEAEKIWQRDGLAVDEERKKQD